MDRKGFIALLLGAFATYWIAHFVWGFELLALFKIFLTKALFIIALLGKQATWEIVLTFVGNFLKRASVKFVFIQLPMAVLMPIAIVASMSPETKKKFKAKKRHVKLILLTKFNAVRHGFDKLFGINGLLAFVISAIASASVFFYAAYEWGFELFVWLGSWGAVGRYASMGWSWFQYMTGGVWNMVMRFPMVGSIVGFLGSSWTKYIASHFPKVDARRKTMVRQALREAREQRIKAIHRRRRLRRALRRRREKIRARQKVAREKALNEKFNRFFWISGTVPRWERIGFCPDTLNALFNNAPRSAALKLYIRSHLGGHAPLNFVEGGDVSWRVLRKK